jgi:hypothetical protein
MKIFIFRLIILLIPFGIGLSLIDCSEEKIISDPDYLFGGFVRDSITGQPIDSAWINIHDSIAPYRAYSDSTGYYKTSVFLGGELMVFCGKEGYYIKDTTINLNTNLDSINFSLTQ